MGITIEKGGGLLIEFRRESVTGVGFRPQRRTTGAGAIQRKMDAGFVETMNDVFFEMVEAHLFARHGDTVLGEEAKERSDVTHALDWIAFQHSFQDVRVVSVEIKRELFVPAACGLFVGDGSDHLGERGPVGGVVVPSSVLYPLRRHVLREEPGVLLRPGIRSANRSGYQRNHQRKQQSFHRKGVFSVDFGTEVPT